MELLWSLYFIDLGFRFLDLDFGFKFWIWIWTQIRSLDFRIWIWIQFEISFFGYEFKFSYVLSNTYIFYLIDFGIWIWDINRWWESKFCCSLSYWIVFLFCLQGRRHCVIMFESSFETVYVWQVSSAFKWILMLKTEIIPLWM